VDAHAVEVSARIPRIIHQTWKDDDIPPEWRGAQAACKALHPEYVSHG
jgi:mannosyltransferase OCH1-like enzyme